MDEQDVPRRRLDDLKAEIRAAVNDAILTYRLTMDRLDKDMELLKSTVYGNPTIRMLGLVDRLSKIEEVVHAVDEKMDQLLDQQTSREADWTRMRAYLERDGDRQAVSRALTRSAKWATAIIAVAVSVLTLFNLLTLLHVIRL